MEPRPLLLGHRGARADKSVPENTPASFDLALAAGCDGFEFDVRLTADGQAVICHDAEICGMEVAQSSAQQLPVSLLRDILIRYQRSAFLDIELKVPGLEAITASLLREFTPARGFVVSSFLPKELESLHELEPSMKLGLICETRPQFRRWTTLPIAYVIPHHKLLREESVKEIKAAGKQILVWTVNTAVDMKRFSEWGVEGIISDYPARLVSALNG